MKKEFVLFIFTCGVFMSNGIAMEIQTEKANPRVGVGVFVFKEGKVLLGKRKGAHGAGDWAPPGGHLEFGESVEDCAQRELSEETGLQALSIQTGPWSNDVIDENKHYITLFAIVNHFEGTPELLEPEKCEEWQWFSIDALPSPLFLPAHAFFEKPFEQFLSFPVQGTIKQEGLYRLSTNLNNALRDELLAMQESDQKARSKLLDIKTFSEELWKDVREIDSKNGQKLKEIVSQYGWPGVSVIGLDGSSALWLLVQHQDHDVHFQKQCLNLLKTAVQEYEASPKSLAYLIDRVNMNENQPQIYGTQWVQQDGKFLLYTVEDREHLDQRRAEMDLSTIAEYKKKIQAAYQLNDEDFK